jgi:hypothetical protein
MALTHSVTAAPVDSRPPEEPDEPLEDEVLVSYRTS